MLNQWDQPLWCGYSVTEKAGGTRWGWCFPWEDFWRHTTTVRSVWLVITHLISYITLAEGAFWRSSSSQRASGLQTARSLLTIINSDRQPLSQRQQSTSGLRWQTTVSWSKWKLVPIRFWQEKVLSLWIPPPATGPHSDCSRGRFLVLGDHYIARCWFGGC